MNLRNEPANIVRTERVKIVTRYTVRVLSRLFRRLFLEQLQKAFDQGLLQFFGDLEPYKDVQAFTRHLAPLKDAEWVVYAKPPFGGPQQVLEYLGRYTHRVSISNQRLLALENGHVSFQWKDYRTKDPSNSKVMTLEVDEFIRRFLLHALPPGLQRIRYAASSPTATVRTTWLSAANY